jgi:hypothetical protein
MVVGRGLDEFEIQFMQSNGIFLALSVRACLSLLRFISCFYLRSSSKQHDDSERLMTLKHHHFELKYALFYDLNHLSLICTQILCFPALLFLENGIVEPRAPSTGCQAVDVVIGTAKEEICC